MLIKVIKCHIQYLKGNLILMWYIYIQVYKNCLHKKKKKKRTSCNFPKHASPSKKVNCKGKVDWTTGLSRDLFHLIGLLLLTAFYLIRERKPFLTNKHHTDVAWLWHRPSPWQPYSRGLLGHNSQRSAASTHRDLLHSSPGSTLLSKWDPWVCPCLSTPRFFFPEEENNKHLTMFNSVCVKRCSSHAW